MRVCTVTCEEVTGCGIDAYRSSAAFHQIQKHSADLDHFHILSRISDSSRSGTFQLSDNLFVSAVKGKHFPDYWARLRASSRLLHRQYHFDVVTAENPFTAGIAALIVARANRLALGIEVHGEILDNLAYQKSRRMGWLVNRVAHSVVSRANAVRVVSLPQLERLRSRGCSTRELVYVPCAVDLEVFGQGSKADSRFTADCGVLFAGRLEKEKNPLALLEIARELRKRGSAIRIWVCGDGSYRAILESTAQQEGLAIDFFGKVPHTTIADAVQRCLCVVLPSFWEGTARIILEAFAAGRPCVASQVEGNQAVISEGVNGYCIPIDRLDLFAERLTKLERNPEKVKMLGEAARRTALQYSVESLRPKYMEYYQRTVDLFQNARQS